MLFIILMVLATVSAVANRIWTSRNHVSHWYLGINGEFSNALNILPIMCFSAKGSS